MWKVKNNDNNNQIGDPDQKMSDVGDLLTNLGRSVQGGGYTCKSNESKYLIHRDSMSKFWLGYSQIIQYGDNVVLSEARGQVAPVMVRMYFEFRDCEEQSYDDNVLVNLTYNIQQCILATLQVDELSRELTCCVSESPDPVITNGNLTMCVKFHFPYCRCDVDYQNEVLLPNLINRLEANNVLDMFFSKPIGGWKDIIYKEYVLDDIPYYGSNDHGTVFEQQFVFGHVDRHDEDPENCKLELSSVFDPTTHPDIGNDRFAISQGQDLAFWLPVFYSVNYWSSEVFPRKPRSTTLTPTYDVRDLGKENDVEMTKIQAIDFFLNMWSDARRGSKVYWLTVGEAIFDAENGEDRGVSHWTDLTEKLAARLTSLEWLNNTTAYEFCSTHYYSFKTDRVTVKSLAWHARQDNRQEYDNWHKEWSKVALEEAISGFHADVAKALYRIYWLDYLCTYTSVSGKSVSWYRFEKHKLRLTPGAHSLKKLISGEFVDKFREMNESYSSQVRRLTDNREQDKGDNAIIKISSLIGKLKNHGYKNQIVGESVELFIHEDLDKFMDDNQELMGMPNGVLVATNDHIEIRTGRPEDYITNSIGVSYRREFSWDHPAVLDVMRWVKQTFPDEELAHYWLKFISSIMRGGNRDKKFYVLSGAVGNNSKSTWMSAIMYMLQDYGVKLPVEASTGSRGDPNGPSPALARLSGTRLCVMEEPGGKPMKASFINHVTGNDPFYARKMKKNGGEIKPYFKFGVIANKMPQIDGEGSATRDRLVIIPFITEWRFDAPESVIEQHRTGIHMREQGFDRTLSSKAPAILWIAVNYFPTYLEEGMFDAPSISKEYTKLYWEENDLYFQFAAESIDIAVTEDGNPDPNAQLTVTEIYSVFKEWYRDSFPTGRIPTRPTMLSELTSRWGRPLRSTWAGLKFKQKFAISMPGYQQAGGSTSGISAF